MSIKLNAQSGGSVALDAPTQTTSSADLTFKLPVADGSANQVIQTNGSGQLAFASPSYKNFGTTTISSASSEIDIDFDVTNYSNFKLYLEGWNPSADCNMYCRY